MLVVHNLGFGFEGQPLFAGLNFRVGPGEICAINGANGAGKTTLLSILAKLRHPTTGSYDYDSALGNDPFAYIAADVNGHFLHQGALSNLSFWADIAGASVTRAQLIEMCEEWQLPKVALIRNLPVLRFSTGMKRKLALLRLALVHKPMWLLDEPLLGLDKQAVASFNKLLGRHLERKGSVVVVSHDIDKLSVKRDYQTLTLARAQVAP